MANIFKNLDNKQIKDLIKKTKGIDINDEQAEVMRNNITAERLKTVVNKMESEKQTNQNVQQKEQTDKVQNLEYLLATPKRIFNYIKTKDGMLLIFMIVVLVLAIKYR